MKLALLISGYPRSLEINMDSIMKHIVQGNDVDIYIYLSYDGDDKYVNKQTSVDKILNTWSPIYIAYSRNTLFSTDTAENAILNQAYKLYKLNEERRTIQNLTGVVYDMVIRCRPDLCFTGQVNLDVDPGYIYLPVDSKMDKHKLQAEDNYVCDVFAYGRPEVMDYYCSWFLALPSLMKTHQHIPEVLLYYYLRDSPHKIIEQPIDYAIILSSCNVIAIAGDSGVGKSTIAEMLQGIFSGAFVLECDRYHKWERDNPMWEKVTHLDPEGNYITKMQKDVFDLKLGNDIHQVDYDHLHGKFTCHQTIASADTVIVCGLHSLYVSDKLCNIKIFVEADDKLRIPWKLQRDSHTRNRTEQNIIDQISSRREDYEKYVAIQKSNSDIIIHYYIRDNMPDKVLLKIGCRTNVGKVEYHDFQYVSNPLEIIKCCVLNYLRTI